jgi:AcrR family transcriptional regulator
MVKADVATAQLEKIGKVNKAEATVAAKQPNKRDLRKIQTRRIIMRAGREVFAARGFDSPRVEDVARAAGISRAAFYLHFGSLEELVKAVFEYEIRWQLRRYRGLTADVLSSERKLRGWLELFFASFRQERRYILIIYRALSANPELMRAISEGHRHTIERLARRLPVLRLLRIDGKPDENRMTRMYFLAQKIEQLSLYSAYDAWTGDPAMALDEITRDLLDFVRLDETRA